MGRGKGLRWKWWYTYWCVMVWSVVVMEEVSGGGKQKEEEEGCASGCGNITNIKHPFRVGNDPAKCGDPRYELACENNVAVLHLYGGKYKVLGINYHNYTIRIVDAGIQRANCSSLPRYFLYQNNFSEFRNRDPYSAFLYDYTFLYDYIIYLRCSIRKAVVRNDGGYVDTAPCQREGHGHTYAFLGDLTVGNLTDDCEVKLVATITSGWRSFLRNKHLSYADIHSVLSLGFEISWWPAACNCLIHQYCWLDQATQNVTCIGYLSDLGIAYRLLTNYVYGIIKGIFQIAERHFGTYIPTDTLPQVAVQMGVVTGRCVIPYIIVRFLLGIIFLLVLIIYTCRRRHLSMYAEIEDFLQLQDLMPVRYSYKELKMMTKGFKTKLGEGGFGTVYQGKLRSGPLVAIKMLGKSKANNGQEFINEVATIGRIHHFNVVHLIGFCVEGSKRALVYEFMPNGSLDKYIFSKEGSVPLNYAKIHEISLGIARGIVYLHHGCDMQILHFDIKPHNILLDDNFTPKISDFGLAKLYPVDDSIVTLTAARGTIGYMAPELFYKNIGKVSYKADVYSFGMLLMEMASKRKNLNPHAEHSSQLYYPLWIFDQFTEEKNIEMVDLTEEEKNLAKKMFIVALWCIQLKPSDRPSMNKVVEMLEAEVEDLEMPPKPSLFPQDDGFNYAQASSIDSIHTSNNPGEIASDEE